MNFKPDETNSISPYRINYSLEKMLARAGYSFIKSSSCPTVYDAIQQAISYGALDLPIEGDLSNLTIIHEKLNVLIDFVNAGVLGDYFYAKAKPKNALLARMDLDVDPKHIYLALDQAFKPGENLFVLGNSSVLKKSIYNIGTTSGGIVMSSVAPNAAELTDDASTPYIRQLVSLNMYVHKKLDG